MKSIIARFTELKENVAGTEESEFDDLDFNNVDKALKSVGVQLKDSTGQFRDLDDVFLELSQKWDTLDRNSQRYIATIAAGSRQQSRFIAMMENYERTVELVGTAYDSAGRGEEQFAKSQDTLQAKLNTLTNTWEQFRLKFFDQTFFKDIIDLANKVLDKISNFDMSQVLALGVIGITLGNLIVTNFIQQLKTGVPKITQAWNQVLNTSLKDRMSLQPTVQGIVNAFGGATQQQQQQFIVQQAGTTLGPKVANAPDMSLQNEAERTKLLQERLLKYQKLKNEEEQIAQKIRQTNSTERETLRELEKKEFITKKLKERELELVNEVRKELGYEREITNENAEQIQQGLSDTTGSPKKGFWKSDVGQSLTSGATLALTTGITTALMTVFTGGDIWTALKTAAMSGAMMLVSSVLTAITPAIISILAGPGGLAVAILGIITAIGVGISNIEAKNKEVEKAELERLSKVEETNKELQKQQEALTKKYKSAQTEYDDFQENINRYNELKNKPLLTSTEQEEIKTIYETLNETYPEIIASYDENTRTIEFNTYALEALQKELQGNIDDFKTQMDLNAQNQADGTASAIEATEKNITEISKQIKPNATGIVSRQDVENLTEDRDMVSVAVKDGARSAGQNIGFFETLSGINFEYAEQAGITEEMYEAAKKGEIDKVGKLLEEAGIDWTEFGLRVIEAGELQIKSYNDLLKDIEENNRKEKFIVEGWDENTADLAAKYEVSREQQLSKTIDRDFKDTKTTIFNPVNKETFAWGNPNQNKDFLNDLQENNFSRIASSENISTVSDAWSSLIKNGSIFDENGSVKAFNDLPKEFVAALDSKIDTDTWEAIKSSPELLVETIQDALTRTVLSNKTANSLVGLDDTQKDAVQNWLNEFSTGINDPTVQTLTDFDKKMNTIVTKIDKIDNLTEEQKKDLRDFGREQITEKTQIWRTGRSSLKNYYDDQNNKEVNNYVNKLSQKGTETLNNNIGGLEVSEAQKRQLLEIMAAELDSYTTKQLDVFASIDLNKDFSELKEAEEEYIGYFQDAGMSANDAKDAYNKYINDITQVIGKGILGENGAEGMKSAVDKEFADTKEKYKELIEIRDKYYKEGKITSEDAAKLQGTEFEKYIERTKDGYKFLAQEAEQDYIDALSNPSQMVENAIGSNEKILEQARRTVDGLQLTGKNINTILEEYKIDKTSIDGYSDNVKTLVEAIATSGQETFEEYEQALIKGTNSLKELDKNAKLEELFILEEGYEKATEEADKATDDLKELQDKLTKSKQELVDLQDELDELDEELIEKQKAIDDAFKEWQDAIHGTENYQSNADGLINYNNLLEETEKKLNNIKENFEDVNSVEEGVNNIQQLKNVTEQQLGQLTAEKQVIENAMENVYQTLTTNYGNYTQFDENGKLAFDFSIEDADMPDTMKDTYQTLVEQYNDFVNQKEDITDKEEDANQAFLDIQKEFLDSRVSMEEKVIDLLKEQMQKEVDQVNEKYEAIEEADNNYLDALEEAINKQRELREQENKYEDLAQKQKKLSLMQRDTSGANQKEVQQLQEEVQNDRQDLLNDEIDNVIDSLKELYEKQAEARELEIEAMEVTIEDMTLLNQMAQDVIAGFQNSDDIVSWFVSNNPAVQDMTVAQTEQYINEVKEESSGFLMSIATQTDDVTLDAERVAEITQATFEEVAQGITDVGTVTQEQAEKTAQEAIDKAKEAYDNAVQAMNDTQSKIEETKNKITETNNEIIKTHDDILLKEQEVQEIRKAQEASLTSMMKKMQQSSKDAITEVAYHATQTIIDFTSKEGKIDDVVKFAQDHGLTDQHGEVSQGTYNAFKDAGYNVDGLKIRQEHEYMINFSPPSSGINIEQGPFPSKEAAELAIKRLKEINGGGTAGEPKKVPKPVQYKTGGLVNYTGPAWVDGTPSKPEAFLSSEDTLRIGEAAKLLASLPALQSTSSTSNISNTKIGDTSIEIHLNIAELSNDYDVDQMVERVKKDIVDVSNSIGSSVILKK